MSKATWTYILMFVALIVGLWAILRYGSTLRAPADISGEWQLEWNSPSAGSMPPHPPRRLTVEQSGRFLAATLDSSDVVTKLKGRLAQPQERGAATFMLESRDGRWRLTGSLARSGTLSGTVEAPYRAAWIARRGDDAKTDAAMHAEVESTPSK